MRLEPLGRSVKEGRSTWTALTPRSFLACWEVCWDRWRELDSACEGGTRASLLAVRAERDQHWQLPPCHTSQSETHVGLGCQYKQWLSAESQAGACPATVDFVSTHTRRCHRNAWLGWTGPGKEYAEAVSWQEHSSPPIPPHSLEPDLGWAGPQSGLSQRQSRFQTVARPPRFPQPQHPGLQHQPAPHHSLALGLGWTQQKGTQPWAAPQQNHGHLHGWHLGLLWPHGPYLLQQSPPLGQSTHSRATEPGQTWPSGLLLQQLWSRHHPDRAVTATEQRGGPTQHPVQAMDAQHQSHPLSKE